MRHFFAVALIGCFGVLGAAAWSFGDEKSTAALPTAEAPEIARLIKQLNDDRFVNREQATQALVKLGQKAVAALGEAVVDERPEVSERAFKALANIHDKGDDAGKTAAAKKLGELAKSDNTGVAKGAKDILERKTEAPSDSPRHGIFGRAIPLGGGFFPGGRIEIRGARIEIGGAGVRRMTIRSTDGGKDIEVTEGDRTVKITENKIDGITVKVTEKKDGKSLTKEYKAANEKELKKNHAEGYKVYKKYAGGLGGAGGVIIGGAGRPGARFEFKRLEKLGGALPEEFRKEIEKELKKALPEGAVPFDIKGAFPGGDIGEALKKAEAELRNALKEGGLRGDELPPEIKKLLEGIDLSDKPAADGAAKKDSAKKELDKAVERLKKLLDGQKDVKKKLEAIKQLEILQAEKLRQLKRQQAELQRELEAAE